MISMNEVFYTLKEVADKMCQSEAWIGERIALGELVACKRGRAKYILHSDLIAYMKGGRQETPEKIEKKLNPKSKENLRLKKSKDKPTEV